MSSNIRRTVLVLRYCRNDILYKKIQTTLSEDLHTHHVSLPEPSPSRWSQPEFPFHSWRTSQSSSINAKRSFFWGEMVALGSYLANSDPVAQVATYCSLK